MYINYINHTCFEISIHWCFTIYYIVYIVGICVTHRKRERIINIETVTPDGRLGPTAPAGWGGADGALGRSSIYMSCS